MGIDKTYLAIDLGASSGRVVAGRYNGTMLTMEVVYRFSTLPYTDSGSLRIDLNRIFDEVVTGLGKAAALAAAHSGPPVSAGVDSWGGQHTIIDSDGRLVEDPLHYRDTSRPGFDKVVHSRMAAGDIYRITGSQESQLPGILANAAEYSSDFSHADRVLLIPDYLNYRLCGRKVNEYSNALLTQFVDIHSGGWSDAVLGSMGIPSRLFGEIVQPGEYLGDLDQRLFPAGSGPMGIVSTASHDTASALGAAPLEGENGAFVSLGTWAILGFEAKEPLITDGTFEAGFQNSSILGQRFALSRSFLGLWILEECRRYWEQIGQSYTFPDLVTLAAGAKPFTSFLNTDSRDFFTPDEMVPRILGVLDETGQPRPVDDGELVRTILEGLALSFRRYLRQLAKVSGRKAESMHIVGGGSRNALLNQFTANSCGIPVIAGPGEATAAGNMIAQLMADGEINTLEEGRQLVKNSFPTVTYEPKEPSRWDEAFEQIEGISRSEFKW